MARFLMRLLPLVFLVASIAQVPPARNSPKPDAGPRYLAFQIFTGPFNSDDLRQAFPPPQDIRQAAGHLRDRIGLTGSKDRRLGLVIGPLSFDNTNDEVHDAIANAFDIALETNVAVGFHLDDSMFWRRRKDLNTVDNVEWLDWNRTPNTGRRLDWSSTPRKIMPQLCVNSKAVRESVLNRAEFVGREIARGVRKLEAEGKGDLFLGVIAGWETQIGRDFDTGKYLGYCALTNKGFSADHPPPDMDAARSEMIREFAGLWARTLAAAGVPEGRVYSHIAFKSEAMYKMARVADPARAAGSYLQAINWTPPATAFCASCVPGLSTYPQPGHLEQWREELEKHGDPAWASSEGTAIDPGVAGHGGSGVDMEGYLGNLFNHGAQLVNVFGWGVGSFDNPFRRIAESDNAVDAYRKFLRGEQLAEAPIPMPHIPPEDLPDKVRRIQEALPAYIGTNGSSKVAPLMEKLAGCLKKQQFDEAATTADEILKLIAR
jgi:hypothetical protein